MSRKYKEILKKIAIFFQNNYQFPPFSFAEKVTFFQKNFLNSVFWVEIPLLFKDLGAFAFAKVPNKM
jgi:hypothetical protein